MRNPEKVLTGLFAVVIVVLAFAFFIQSNRGQRAWQQFMLPHQSAVGDVDGGRDLAITYCADCHEVGRGRTSPVAEAPPFREVVKRWPVEFLAEALAEGISVNQHETVQMPEFAFESEQIDNLLAYLESLK